MPPRGKKYLPSPSRRGKLYLPSLPVVKGCPVEFYRPVPSRNYAPAVPSGPANVFCLYFTVPRSFFSLANKKNLSRPVPPRCSVTMSRFGYYKGSARGDCRASTLGPNSTRRSRDHRPPPRLVTGGAPEVPRRRRVVTRFGFTRTYSLVDFGPLSMLPNSGINST